MNMKKVEWRVRWVIGDGGVGEGAGRGSAAAAGGVGEGAVGRGVGGGCGRRRRPVERGVDPGTIRSFAKKSIYSNGALCVQCAITS